MRPLPSAVPVSPEIDPARVVTSPAEVILRIALFLLSANRMLPEESTTIPFGSFKKALVPFAFKYPDTEESEPAIVVTLDVATDLTW